LYKKTLLQLPTNSQEHLNEFFKFTNFVHLKGQVIVQLNVDSGADEAGNSGEGGSKEAGSMTRINTLPKTRL
jgi:hypothetical protein